MAAKTINLNEKIPAEEEIDNPVQHASDRTPTDQTQNGVTDTAPLAENSADAAPNKETGVSESTESPVLSPTENDDVPANDIDKKMRRAERFGVPVHLTETEKRNSRAERFGIAAVSNKSETVSKPAGSNKSEKLEAVSKPEDLKRKARAERFGASKPSVDTTEEDAKKKARLARFAPASKTDPEEDDKRKARALRFSNPPLNASHANGSKAIAGKASEGS